MEEKIYIGACYYPEQWIVERIETDTSLMQAAGINVVRMTDLCWSTMEPEDGIFDFSIFDIALEHLHKRGIQAIMCTPTEVPPMWMWKSHADIMAIAPDRTYNNEIRSRYCSNNPTYIRYVERFVRKIAEHYKDHPAVIGWQIDNEFNGTPCICENCSREFRKWLQECYGSLDALNREWGTVFWSQIYTDWSQLAPPSRATELTFSVSQKVDFLRFTSDSTLKFAKRQVDILKEVCPHHKLTHNGMGQFDRVDYYKLGQLLDFYSWDSYPAVDTDMRNLCLSHDLSRGIKEKNYWVMEQKNGYFNYAPYNLAIEPGLVRLWSWQDIARGADGVVYFRWRSGRFGSEQHPQGLLRHDGSKRRAYDEVKQLTAELATVGKDLAGSRFMADAAILWSFDQIWAFETHVQNEKFSYKALVKEYYNAFFSLGVNIDIVNPGADLKKYKLVVAPALFMMNEAIAQNLKEYVKAGGTLILTIRTGVRTWSNITVDTPWPGLLYDITGAAVVEFDSLPSGVSNKVFYNGKSYEVNCFLEMLEPVTAKTLAVYEEKFYKGQTAISSNSFGMGKVLYCGVMGNGELLKALLGDELREKGIETYTWPQGIEVTYRRSDNTTYMFVLNTNFVLSKVIIEGEYTDVLSGKKVSGEVELEKLGVMVLVKE